MGSGFNNIHLYQLENFSKLIKNIFQNNVKIGDISNSIFTTR